MRNLCLRSHFWLRAKIAPVIGAHQVAMATHRTKLPWVHPRDDPSLALERFLAHNPEDPRAKGHGPCGKIHMKPMDATAENIPEMAQFG